MVSSTDGSSLETFVTSIGAPCLSLHLNRRTHLRAVFASCRSHPEGAAQTPGCRLSREFRSLAQPFSAEAGPTKSPTTVAIRQSKCCGSRVRSVRLLTQTCACPFVRYVLRIFYGADFLGQHVLHGLGGRLQTLLLQRRSCRRLKHAA